SGGQALLGLAVDDRRVEGRPVPYLVGAEGLHVVRDIAEVTGDQSKFDRRTKRATFGALLSDDGEGKVRAAGQGDLDHLAAPGVRGVQRLRRPDHCAVERMAEVDALLIGEADRLGNTSPPSVPHSKAIAVRCPGEAGSAERLAPGSNRERVKDWLLCLAKGREASITIGPGQVEH